MAKEKVGYIGFFAIIVVWSLWSLPYSPIVWLDEVYLASVTHSFISGNGLTLDIDQNQPIFIYGPVYFFITGLITKLFGFGVFTYRLANCIFSFGCVWVLDQVLKTLKIGDKLRYVSLVILLTDYAFFANSHSGRNEFVALFFALIAYWVYLRKDIKTWRRAAYISLFITLSVFTTPRVVVVAVVPALLELKNLIVNRQWVHFTIYILIPVLFCTWWMLYAFGTPSAMVAYYYQPDNSSLVDRHFGGNFYLAIYHYPLALSLIFIVCFAIWKKFFGKILFFLVPILLFHFLIYDFGLYIVYALPFYIILLAWSIYNCDQKWIKKGLQVLAFICLIINISTTFGKAIMIVETLEQRDPNKVYEWLKNEVPTGSKIAGNYAYYYAAIDNHCQFKRIVRDSSHGKEEDVAYLKSYFNPDYILLQENDTVLQRICAASFKLKKKNSFVNNSKNNSQLKGMSSVIMYDGIVYKVEQ